MQRTILHLDMNSYFATAEQQVNPYLQGKPVGIIKAEGRGCVIAASIEAKKFGVKTGTTVWEAKKLCPQIVLVPSDMDKYFALTQRMIKILADYSPTLEVFSIDECFVDVTDSQKLWAGGVWQMAIEMKLKIREELGEWMKCSIGISFTKLLAKLASEMKKPDGLTFLTPESYLEETKNVAVSEICGIGYARTAYLHSRGAYTLEQARLLKLPIEIEDLVWLRINDELTTVGGLDPAKSVSRTYATYETLNSKFEILKLTRNLVEEACMKLREMGMCGRTFCLSLDGLPAGRQDFWARVTIKTPTDDPLVIYDLLNKEYEKRPTTGVRQAGVWISSLMFNVQGSMFNKRPNLLRAVDKVNEKWGLFTMYPGVLLGSELIRPEVTGFLGDKWYRFRESRL
ncbi:MAG: DNA polymerase IV [Microgenomates group bacterium Gr01-1014_16]|nr:MAG: DNA polymerase IV [Microgenomates group bacterium Gr01-1014_16]